MPQPIVIPLELKIIPGGLSSQNRIIVTASGETVIDEYEQHISAGFREAIGKCCEAHARLMHKFGGSIAR